MIATSEGGDSEPMPATGVEGPAGTVVHLVAGHDAVRLRRVAQLTRAQIVRGVPQTVVLLDDARLRPLLPRFDAEVHLVLVATRPLHALPRRLIDTLRHELRRTPASLLRSHGWLACALGKIAATLGDLGVPVRCAGFPRLRRALAAAQSYASVSPWSPPAMLHPVTPQHPFDLPEALFHTARREALRPLVVTASLQEDARHAARFAQLAVLLRTTSDALAFNWIGPADAAACAQLSAAGVGLYEARDPMRRAARLRPAWIYAALGSGPAAARGLAEAMALGLACIAWDSALHRGLIEHGRTGLLCNSEVALLEGVASLLDAAELRERLGAAAREAAIRLRLRLGAEQLQVASGTSPVPVAPSPSTVLPLDR